MLLRRISLLSPFTLAFLLIVSILSHNLKAQVNQPEETPIEADSIQILPFQTSRFTEAFNRSFSLINESGEKQLAEHELENYTTQIDTLFSQVDQFIGDSLIQTLDGISIRELENTTNRTDYYLEEVAKLQDQLSGIASRSEKATEVLSLDRTRWALTLDRIDSLDVPEERILRIGRTITREDSVKSILQTDLSAILTQQDRLSDKSNALETLLTRIENQRLIQSEKLFSRDMPGFFQELATLGDTALVKNHLDQLKKSLKTDVEVIESKFYVPLLIISLLFILLLIFSIWYKKHFARLISVEKFELSDIHLTIIYSPVVSVIFVSAVLIRLVFPDLPHTFSALNLMVLMIPMLIIVIRLFGSMVRSWMQVLIAIYFLTFVYELVYYPDIILRITLLLLSLSGFLLFMWIIIKRPLESRFKNQFVYKLFRTMLMGFAILLFIAIVGNLLGAFRLAEFFTLIPIQVVVLAIGIQVVIKVVETIVFLFLASNGVQRLHVFRDEFDVIYKKTTRFINFLFWLFFIVTAMNIFRIKEPFFEWGRAILTTGRKVGEIYITPGSILIFIFVIWLSVFLSRVIRHILEKDVFARISTSKGMPSTIILLVRIGLITGGFFLAAAAAGMALTNLSIVLGAFSVGIGFGLQNIFNNMVSGLILAFERPIKVGDTVQVGELLGEVKSIGLRSSTVRSIDGAEVIVPNGNLISDIMINWTLSDAFRRMDIKVGVAYGTDPEKVIAIMEKVAKTHKLVRRIPPPEAYFIGFGDSSLDFKLLAWSLMEHRLEVESDMNVGINRGLKEAGIEIPFPQRDLHIRSDATRETK